MRVLTKKVIKETAPVNLIEAKFEDQNGEVKPWVYVERKKNQFAVFVVAIIKDSPAPVSAKTFIESPQLILNKEYRVPIQAYCYDLPAGLAEINESPIEAAKRELLEETGYELSEILSVSPRNYSSPGITNEYCYIVYGYASPVRKETAREASEDIHTVLVNRDEAQHILDNPNLNLGTRAYMSLRQFVSEGLFRR